jgi:hypothetical protein
MKQLPKLALCLMLGAGPAAAQTRGCMRDASGAFSCTARPIVAIPNAARRTSSTRDLSAAAIARGRAQAESIRDAVDQQRRDADSRAGQMHQLGCAGSSSPPGGSRPPNASPCGY